MTNKTYQIIYADPPWAYSNFQGKGSYYGDVSRHYKTMSKEEIENLNVELIADKNCILFLWATYPKLQEALETIKAWGFIYKTVAFTWVKQNKVADGWHFGLGYWTRGNREICLLATKGKPKRIDCNVANLTISHLQEHSKKPDIIRDKIVQLVGDLPRIELFARQKTEGWDIWGNELQNDIEL